MVQMGKYSRGDDSGDEELRAVGVLASIGHGQQARLGVLQLEVLVREAVTVDCKGISWSGKGSSESRGVR
jgi:hypothetical protein